MSDVAMLLMADAKFMIFNAKPLFRFLLMLFGVFLDQKANERCIIRFDKAKDYSETNKVYLVRIGNSTTLGYLTAYPNNEDKLCDSQTSIAAEGTQEYKNQEWKVITKNEYYKLFNVSPANMKSVVDASFLIACPDFRANDADALQWAITNKG